jgi:hypothetical protein
MRRVGDDGIPSVPGALDRADAAVEEVCVAQGESVSRKR